MFFPANHLACYYETKCNTKQAQIDQEHTDVQYTKVNKCKELNPGLVALYSIWPEMLYNVIAPLYRAVCQ